MRNDSSMPDQCADAGVEGGGFGYTIHNRREEKRRSQHCIERLLSLTHLWCHGWCHRGAWETPAPLYPTHTPLSTTNPCSFYYQSPVSWHHNAEALYQRLARWGSCLSVNRAATLNMRKQINWLNFWLWFAVVLCKPGTAASKRLSCSLCCSDMTSFIPTQCQYFSSISFWYQNATNDTDFHYFFISSRHFVSATKSFPRHFLPSFLEFPALCVKHTFHMAVRDVKRVLLGGLYGWVSNLS